MPPTLRWPFRLTKPASVASASAKPTVMIMLQLASIMAWTLPAYSPSAFDSIWLVWMPSSSAARIMPLCAVSLKDLSSKPPASETMQAR